MDTPFEDKNLGNLKSISLIALDNLLTIPGVLYGEISYNDLIFAEGKAFQEIYFTPETGSFIQKKKKTRAGSIWEKEINLQIPRIRSEIISDLEKYEDHKIAALVTDGNDTSYLVFPLNFLMEIQIPGQITSKNAILLNLTCVSISKSPVITDLP